MQSETTTPAAAETTESDAAFDFVSHVATVGDEHANQEVEELLSTLETHRNFLFFTVRNLSEEAARTQPTVSELTLGGLLKHVRNGEQGWTQFIVEGPSAIGDFVFSEEVMAQRANDFLLGDETLAEALARYAEVAERTAAIVRAEPSLDRMIPLPSAPWFPEGGAWSVRRVVLHIIAETAQHAGHADILRETIDGQRTMG